MRKSRAANCDVGSAKHHVLQSNSFNSIKNLTTKERLKKWLYFEKKVLIVCALLATWHNYSHFSWHFNKKGSACVALFSGLDRTKLVLTGWTKNEVAATEKSCGGWIHCRTKVRQMRPWRALLNHSERSDMKPHQWMLILTPGTHPHMRPWTRLFHTMVTFRPE